MSTSRFFLLGLACLLSATVPASAQRTATPPQGAPGTVTLSLDQYDRLLERAERPVRHPEPPPIPAVLSRADLHVRVTGARARGTFTLEGEVFQTGLTKIPLISDATLLDARLGTTSVPLVTEGATATALVDGPRPFSIALEWGAPLSPSPGRASVHLPVPMAGSATLSLDLPDHPSDVRIVPGVITRATPATGVTRIEATLVPGSQTVVSWSSREAAVSTTPQATRILADIKSLVSVGDVELRMTALVEVTVLRGEPDRFEVRLPEGFSATGATGSALAGSEERPGALVLAVQRPADRRHQFLLSMERPAGDRTALQAALVSVAGVERETGEVAVEAAGTVDLTAQETDIVKRMDVREASATLRSMARTPVLAALRYHRRGVEPAVLLLNVTRFPDAEVVAAVAERATVTTLVTSEGRTLTEIALTMRNRAQPFLRVELPQGASIVSAEVQGEMSKPAQGVDGARVPLLRPGFRPTGPYTVSFVYLQDGPTLANRGRAEFMLPKMDVPVTLVEWEMFVPDKYRLRRFDGNARPVAAGARGGVTGGVGGGLVGGVVQPGARISVGQVAGIGPGSGGGTGGGSFASGQLLGTVSDISGAVLPGATVRVLHGGRVVGETTADPSGSFLISNVPAGGIVVEASLGGFTAGRVDFSFDTRNARRVDFQLSPAAIAETVSVSASTHRFESGVQKQRDDSYAQAPSSNVFNLQRRVAGVLPVRVDVPRAGAAYRFIRPLVLDETTRVSFEYRSR